MLKGSQMLVRMSTQNQVLERVLHAWYFSSTVEMTRFFTAVKFSLLAFLMLLFFFQRNKADKEFSNIGSTPICATREPIANLLVNSDRGYISPPAIHFLQCMAMSVEPAVITCLSLVSIALFLLVLINLVNYVSWFDSLHFSLLPRIAPPSVYQKFSLCYKLIASNLIARYQNRLTKYATLYKRRCGLSFSLFFLFNSFRRHLSFAFSFKTYLF